MTNIAVTVICWIGISVAASTASAEPVVYIAKDIVTMEPAMPTAQAVAVAEGRILGVGSREEMIELAGGDSVSVDSRFTATGHTGADEPA